ncbi:MAG: mechanosensitive ion channel, partial [Bacteroidales bacterium]|nr:mechanosensitive ion channel [Bacteroidales bacterium]
AWLIKRIKRLVMKGFEKKGTEPTLVTFVSSFLTILLWTVLIVITITTLGVNTTSIAALLAAGGVALGMALSGTVQNFAGGVMLLVFKPFKVGDYIEAQGYAGFVKEVNIVSTKLTTTDNKTVILPNGALSNGNISNYFPSKLRRVDITVNVAYGASAEKVKEEILNIISADERILNAETPGADNPFVALKTLKDSSIEFVVRAWVNSPDYWPVYFNLTERIYTELPKREGISFPFPQLDVHIKEK